MRPPGPYLPSLVPIKFDFGEEAGASSAFSWRWWEIPFSWTDEDGTPFASFPLPVAALHGPSVEGAQHLVSLTALFHVWPSSSNPHKFASERESERWDYWRSLGVTPGELLSSKRSVSCKRRRGADAPPRARSCLIPSPWPWALCVSRWPSLRFALLTQAKRRRCKKPCSPT